jgi:hypothetical protein
VLVMDSLSKAQTQRVEPTEADFLQAIRDTLVAGPRANKLAVRDDEAVQSGSEGHVDPPLMDRPAAPLREEDGAPSIAGADDPVTEHVEHGPLTGRAATLLQEELHQALRIAGRDRSFAENGDDTPRIASIRQRLHSAPIEEFERALPFADKPVETINEELHDAPSISIVEPPLDLTFRPAGLRDAELPAESSLDQNGEPSLLHRDTGSSEDGLFTRPSFKIVTRGIILIAAIAVAFAFLPIRRTDLSQALSIAEPTAETTTQSEDAAARADVAPAVAAPTKSEQRSPAETAIADLGVLRQQMGELIAKQNQMAMTLASRQAQLKTLAGDFAALRRQLEEVGARQAQMTLGTRQEAVKISDVATLLPQKEELAAKQDQITDGNRQDQLKTMLGDVAALRQILEKVTVRQDEMAAEIAQLQAGKKSTGRKFGVHTRWHR